MKLMVFLLIAIIILSILGTLIPQGEGARAFAAHLAPGLAFLFHKLQLFDIYHSLLFVILMILLSLNLIVCSWSRFPTSWRLFRRAFSSLPDRPSSPHKVFVSQGRLEEESLRLENLLRKRYRKVRREDKEGVSYLYGRKGFFSYFGMYIVHLSVLIIIGGAVIGNLFGFGAYMEIPDGGFSDTVRLEGRDDFKKLDFTVRCDRFSLELYDNGAPKSYRSDLTFLIGNQVAYKGPLLVNHPIKFEGIRFYQASYGTITGSKAIITVRKNDQEVYELYTTAGTDFKLPGEEVTGKILRIEENLMGLGPSVKIAIHSAEGDLQFWVFQYIERIIEKNPSLFENVPLLNPGLFKPYLFSLDGFESKYYTGLQVKHDPGVSTVAVGSFLLVFGFMVVFFSSSRQIWINLETEGKWTRISIGGKDNKNPVGLQRDLSYFMRKITEEQE